MKRKWFYVIGAAVFIVAAVGVAVVAGSRLPQASKAHLAVQECRFTATPELTYDLNETIRLTVNSDKDAQLTIENYNVELALQANKTASTTFKTTRSGVFEMSDTGQLLTPLGLTVLSDGGAPIDIPQGSQIMVGADGTITSTLPGEPSTQIGRLKLASPTAEEPLKRSDDGLFRTASGNPLPNDPNARMLSGSVEGSNVNPVECMVGMIAASRQFEQQIKLLQTAEQNDKSAGQLLSLNG